jgi:hypothetical protein
MKPSSRDIDIVAFSGTRVWSRIIRLRSQSRFSHVGIVCEINGDDWVIEALERKGVRLVPLRVWYQWNGDVTAFRLKTPLGGDASYSWLQGRRREIINFAAQRIGQEYASPWQFFRSFGFATRWLCRKIGVRKDLESDRFFCSELVAESLKSAGFWIGLDPSEMTPGDICGLPCLERVAI